MKTLFAILVGLLSLQTSRALSLDITVDQNNWHLKFFISSSPPTPGWFYLNGIESAYGGSISYDDPIPDPLPNWLVYGENTVRFVADDRFAPAGEVTDTFFVQTPVGPPPGTGVPDTHSTALALGTALAGLIMFGRRHGTVS